MLTDEQRAEGWIEHDGRPSPFDSTPRGGIEVTLRCGFIGYVSHCCRTWEHTGCDTDIIAYKPENPHD